MGSPVLDFLVLRAVLVVCVACLRLLPPNCIFLSLKRMLKALAPIVEKLVVRLLLAALMAVIIRISAKMPSAIMITVMAVRNLFTLTFFQESESES
jgi:hypothetical protein